MGGKFRVNYGATETNLDLFLLFFFFNVDEVQRGILIFLLPLGILYSCCVVFMYEIPPSVLSYSSITIINNLFKVWTIK